MPGEERQLSVHRHNGMVTKVRRVEPSVTTSTLDGRPSTAKTTDILRPGTGHDAQQSDHSSASLSQDPPPSRRGRKGFTVHWPFQTHSVATDTLSVFTTQPALFRRATWNPPPQTTEDDGDTSPRDSTLIPDYIVNFIRGETPETVARRKQNGGARGARAINLTHHKPQHSHMAMLMDSEGVEYVPGSGVEDGDAHSHVTSSSTATELQQILPRDQQGGKGWRKLTVGWKSGVALNLLLSLAILIAGFVCFVVAGFEVAFLVGDTNLFTGSCSAAMSLHWGLHAVINVLVLVLLVGANYTFQVLSSPTRSEIAMAHANRRWLDIGIPSLRNCRYIGGGRSVLAMTLLTVALATQVIYNSIVFVSETGFDYNLIAVDSSFLTGTDFANTTVNNGANVTRDEILNLQRLAADSKLTTLSSSECINLFSAVFNNEFQNILLIVNGATTSNSLITTEPGGLNASAASNPSTQTTTTGSQILVAGAAVTSCLAQPTDMSQDSCTLNLNGLLFVIVLALNLFAVFLTGSTLLLRRFQPLVTLGDAIASFLRDPDPTTRQNALLTTLNLKSKMGGWGFTEGKYWAPTRDTRWFRTASLSQWLTFSLFFALSLGLLAGALALALASQILEPPTLSSFGRPTPRATFLFDSSLTVLSLVAALPQLLVACLYLSTNGLLTAFFLSKESALYAASADKVERRGLRVSTAPVGAQTSSLFLTLPRPVSWGLAAYFAAMGFVLSRACFAVSLLPEPGSAIPSTHLTGIGFSGVALAVLLGMVGVLGLVIAGVAVGKQVPGAMMSDGRAVGNPLVFEGGCVSAVVSARCHRVPAETDVWWGQLAWGVVPESDMPPAAGPLRHVTYTAGPVDALNGTHQYV